MLALVMVCASFCMGAMNLKPGYYYTWGVDVGANVPMGMVPTQVTFEFDVQDTIVPIEGGPIIFEVYMVDNPPLGFAKNQGELSVATIDHALLYKGPVDANGLTLNLREIDTEIPWVRSLFEPPFSIMFPREGGGPQRPIEFNSVLLGFLDYAGNSTPVGLIINVIGGEVRVGSLKLNIVAESYGPQYQRKNLTYEKMLEPDLDDWKEWADKLRAEFAADLMRRLVELEKRIEEARPK